jgi:hypothetical protein
VRLAGEDGGAAADRPSPAMKNSERQRENLEREQDERET